MRKKIVVFGSYVTDLTAFAPQLPVPGQTILGKYFRSGPGGKGSNQAIAIHRTGEDVTLITKLGKDALGEMAQAFYQNEAMEMKGILIDQSYETGAALIIVDEKTAQNEIVVTLGPVNILRKKIYPIQKRCWQMQILFWLSWKPIWRLRKLLLNMRSPEGF